MRNRVNRWCITNSLTHVQADLDKTGGVRPKTRALAANPNSNLLVASEFYHGKQSPSLF